MKVSLPPDENGLAKELLAKKENCNQEGLCDLINILHLVESLPSMSHIFY